MFLHLLGADLSPSTKEMAMYTKGGLPYYVPAPTSGLRQSEVTEGGEKRKICSAVSKIQAIISDYFLAKRMMMPSQKFTVRSGAMTLNQVLATKILCIVDLSKPSCKMTMGPQGALHLVESL
jgi:hypothetical protein